ncbi:hypothetical protein ACD591_17015 [Rufibacter glacialis]|uniref:Uncharacterized protein n=1 Tax=Rufibacter glacialis TaxID=1259555 RepID=A0A5M8QE10_9BACT|nr:hypothetical protein [Rufibacter glacialis]KAA6434285.1 hypothetical protein FOE74_08750 [Rufibacter glacialis]GGK68306.1 hypothetical protein GCM10011405_15440 [Rufibacter glacialis]
MLPSTPDLPFLQQLFGQDTLYVIPEPAGLENLPLTTTAKATPSLPKPASGQVESPLEEPAVAKEPVIAVKEPLATPIPPVPAVAPQAPAPNIRWQGEAVKGTYLLFEVPEPTFLSLPQHAFLQKVLAAVGLNTGQVQFGNLSRSIEHDVKTIAAQQQAKHILLFGQGLPVANLSRMEFYRMYKFEESRFVLVDALEDIEKSVELKKKLWDVLQKIFLP